MDKGGLCRHMNWFYCFSRTLEETFPILYTIREWLRRRFGIGLQRSYYGADVSKTM
jgi:hypothetical protein